MKRFFPLRGEVGNEVGDAGFRFATAGSQQLTAALVLVLLGTLCVSLLLLFRFGATSDAIAVDGLLKMLRSLLYAAPLIGGNSALLLVLWAKMSGLADDPV